MRPWRLRKSELIPNIIHLGEEIINGLSVFLAHTVKMTQKLILVSKTGSLIAFLQKIPDGLGWRGSRLKLEPTKLKADGCNRSIAKPGDDLIVFTIPIF